MRTSRDLVYLVVIALLIALCGQLIYSYKYVPAQERKVEVFYNQDIHANEKIIQTIQDAEQYVYFTVYTFTRTDIKDALLGAKYRGLDVQGVVDRDQTERIESQKKIVSELKRAGIPVSTQDHSGIMHLKTVVTERGFASGSYNWTSSATTINDEILEVGTDEHIRSQYETVVKKLLHLYERADD